MFEQYVDQLIVRLIVQTTPLVGTPLTYFVHHGVKLWNNASRAVKDAKTKWAAKKAVKEYIRGMLI
jgi:hypothetical protein